MPISPQGDNLLSFSSTPLALPSEGFAFFFIDTSLASLVFFVPVDSLSRVLAGVAGIEPATYGFGDRRSTN